MFSFCVLITVPHWACSLVLLHVCTLILILILIYRQCYAFVWKRRKQGSAHKKTGSLGLQSKQQYTTLLQMPSLLHILHWRLFSLRDGKCLSQKLADGGASSKGCGSSPAGRFLMLSYDISSVASSKMNAKTLPAIATNRVKKVAADSFRRK